MLKQILYAGLGLVTITREKAEELVSELVKRGELSSEEGKDALNNILDRMQEERDKLRQRIQEQVENMISSMNLVRQSELDDIKQRLEKLEMKYNITDKEEEV
ncbi:MAG: phasin family protein [Tepidanaerobacteraceae bacterium]